MLQSSSLKLLIDAFERITSSVDMLSYAAVPCPAA
jgi:hypothetical protein